MTDDRVQLRPLLVEHRAMVCQWLTSPHVAVECSAAAQSAATLTPAGPDVEQRLIEWNGLVSGGVEWRLMDAAARERNGVEHIEGALFALTVIIGSPGAIGHGLGQAAMREALEEISRNSPRCTVVASAKAGNAAACKAFLRAGFVLHRERVRGASARPVFLWSKGLAEKRASGH